MKLARQVIIGTPACRGTPRLTVVTTQRGQGAMPTGEELNGLVTLVAAGDRQAFAVLFKHLAPRVKAYLVRGGTPAASAEELVQEAMVLLWKKAATFDPARAGVSTWIFTIARNLRIDRYRHHRSNAGSNEDGGAIDLHNHDPADPAASPDEDLGARQREALVRAALKQLSADQAQVIQLSYFAEKPHAAIAGDLRIPLGTVKSRIRLAVAELRRLLEAAEP